MATPAGLALEGADPRRPSVVQIGDKKISVAPDAAAGTGKKLNDPNVSFEEYLYFASLSRADDRFEELNPDYKLWGITFKKNRHGNDTLATTIAQVMGGEAVLPAAQSSSGPQAPPSGQPANDEKEDKRKSDNSGESALQRYGVSDDEYTMASRAIRTAGWSSVFFLITTDILGPFSAPTAIAYMGYGPGVVLYTVFAVLAAYGGFLLWKMYMGLDSYRYPLRTYGDIPFRIYGNWARHACSVLQFLQLLINVAILTAQNALSLEEILVGAGRPGVCFLVLIFVWAAAGALFGQIRTLKRIGWLGNASVWLNVITMIMIMAVAAHTDPNYDAGTALNGPVLGFTDQDPHVVKTYGGAPPNTGFSVQVQGLQLAVFAYGGATIFIELMAEMRRPWDFWKGMITAQVFIYLFYVLFGVLVYAYQGQYSVNPAYQGLGPYAWQTAANIIQLFTTFIAALLYGNVGLKVAYNAVLRDIFRFPDLAVRGGKLMWVGMVPIFWAVAFVIAAAIPNISNLGTIVAAVAILQFSYTFPPMFFVGYLIKRDAMLPGDGYDPATGRTIRQDAGLKRHLRGFKKHWILNSWHTFYFLGSLATAGLGIYAAIVSIIAAYSQGSQDAFSCHSIYNP